MAMPFSCVVCGRSDVALFRINPKGEKGIFACREHKLSPPDPVVEDIATIIQRANVKAG